MHPDLFGADDAGYPEVLGATVGANDRAEAQGAVDNCPEGAITLSASQD